MTTAARHVDIAEQTRHGPAQALEGVQTLPPPLMNSVVTATEVCSRGMGGSSAEYGCAAPRAKVAKMAPAVPHLASLFSSAIPTSPVFRLSEGGSSAYRCDHGAYGGRGNSWIGVGGAIDHLVPSMAPSETTEPVSPLAGDSSVRASNIVSAAVDDVAASPTAAGAVNGVDGGYSIDFDRPAAPPHLAPLEVVGNSPLTSVGTAPPASMAGIVPAAVEAFPPSLGIAPKGCTTQTQNAVEWAGSTDECAKVPVTATNARDNIKTPVYHPPVELKQISIETTEDLTADEAEEKVRAPTMLQKNKDTASKLAYFRSLMAF